MNERLEKIFREVLKDENIVLSDSLSEKEVPTWNSLNNILLINKIEESFSVKFDLAEILEIKNVGDIKRHLESKLA